MSDIISSIPAPSQCTGVEECRPAAVQSSVIARLLLQQDATSNILGNKVSGYQSAKHSASNSKVGGSSGLATASLAICYSLILIVLTGLVATLFAQQDSVVSNSLGTLLKRKAVSLVSQGWIITPGDCEYWYNGDCISKISVPDQETLGGIISERERKANGLFSSINVPFLCLAASVISAAFSIGITPSSDFNAQRMLKILSMLVLVVFGTLFLFMQTSWNLPVNNVLLVEFSFVAALFILLSYSVKKGSYVDVARLIDMTLTNPLLAVCVLSASGEDNTNCLILVHASMVFGHWALVANYTESVHQAPVTPGFSAICQRAYWLCMVPFIVQYSLRFHYLVLGSTLTQPTWSIAVLSFTFAAYIIRSFVISFQSWYISMESEGSITTGEKVLSTQDELMNADCQAVRTFGMLRWGFLELFIKLVIYLLIMIGYFVELES